MASTVRDLAPSALYISLSDRTKTVNEGVVVAQNGPTAKVVSENG